MKTKEETGSEPHELKRNYVEIKRSYRETEERRESEGLSDGRTAEKNNNSSGSSLKADKCYKLKGY